MSNDTLQYFLMFFSRVLMLLLIMPLTNSARGLTAKYMGDDSADREGRITLNPFVHLDPLGSLAILFIGFGWSKPMPINPAKMKNRKWGIVAVSAAGPLTHFVSAVLCYIGCNILAYAPVFSDSQNGITMITALEILFQLLAQINVCLGTINILPLPPMDGFNIINQFLGNRFHKWYFGNYININRVSMGILLLLFFLPSDINPLHFLIGFFNGITYKAASWVPAIFR
ncbi:MAG TPA: hypothetical protein DCZ71_02115 [Ruminococcus sp.]|nr:hypothetical protein [Ruminococcus sp.]